MGSWLSRWWLLSLIDLATADVEFHICQQKKQHIASGMAPFTSQQPCISLSILYHFLWGKGSTALSFLKYVFILVMDFPVLHCNASATTSIHGLIEHLIQQHGTPPSIGADRSHSHNLFSFSRTSLVPPLPSVFPKQSLHAFQWRFQNPSCFLSPFCFWFSNFLCLKASPICDWVTSSLSLRSQLEGCSSNKAIHPGFLLETNVFLHDPMVLCAFSLPQ